MATPENPFAFNDATAAEIAVGLIRRGEVHFGDFTLRSGAWSPMYVDLRPTASAMEDNPSAPTMTMAEQLRFRSAVVFGYCGMLGTLAEAERAEGRQIDHVSAIPEAVCGIAPMVAYEAGLSYLHRRIKQKDYGLPSDGILGDFGEGQQLVMIDDLISSSGAKIDEMRLLEDISRPGKDTDEVRGMGLVVQHALILLDRETGGIEAAAEAGLEVHAGLTMTQVLDIGLAEGAITPQDYNIAKAYMSGELTRKEDKHLFV